MDSEQLIQIGEIHTDLAMEARELAMERSGGSEPAGVNTQTEKQGDTLITRVNIETAEAGQAIGKQPGFYVTLEAPGLRTHDRDKWEEIAFLMAKEIEGYIARFQLGDDDPCLVVGLGNWSATPDALGPKVVEHILVTRHLQETAPPEKKGGLRPVCALAPGVLGTTGMETGEIVMGVVQRTKPKFVVVIDALASRSTQRMGATLQIADTGIHPGSGLGNKRIGLTPQTLGVPVIAIGVPTVVEATTIVQDALQEMTRMAPSLVSPKAVNQRELIGRVLSPYLNSLIVTPKEIDVMIEDLARVVSGALNIALHPAVSPEEVFRYLT
ncbi:spore protease [Hydrogenispora ethanolica]|jgi:spore protease|uniref:Spore protease n=1 Tax=Hydrogenispora ethanolica TaxID=1082276 RepID=A0A4R1REE8_HYDET|nr:GPR endopeptidase [Hydrogenispora ethanolica]TCL64273.1 spore protease [Hydrogenispora ethanolica]